MATETYVVGFGAAVGTGGLSSLGSPYQSYAETSAAAPVYSAAAPATSFAGPALTPLTQLAQTATTVTYASSVASDQFAVFGAPVGSPANFGAPVGAPASAPPSNSIQNFASNTNASTVTNGYQPNVAYASSAFGSPFGSPFGGATFSVAPQPGFSAADFTETPEPSTWVLVGTALAGIVAARRRRTA